MDLDGVIVRINEKKYLCPVFEAQPAIALHIVDTVGRRQHLDDELRGADKSSLFRRGECTLFGGNSDIRRPEIIGALDFERILGEYGRIGESLFAQLLNPVLQTPVDEFGKGHLDDFAVLQFPLTVFGQVKFLEILDGNRLRPYRTHSLILQYQPFFTFAPCNALAVEVLQKRNCVLARNAGPIFESGDGEPRRFSSGQ